MRVVDCTKGGADSPEAAAAEVLLNGGVVVLPTDTVYGVAALCTPAGEAALYAVKKRDRRKPIPILAADREAVVAFGARLDAAEACLARTFWPGALTLVLSVPSVGVGIMEGFRVPDDERLRRILAAVGGVLRVTSANLSGEPPALTAAEAVRALGGSVDLVLDAGPVRGGVPSTVVRFREGVLQILREGALPETALKKALESGLPFG